MKYLTNSPEPAQSPFTDNGDPSGSLRTGH